MKERYLSICALLAVTAMLAGHVATPKADAAPPETRIFQSRIDALVDEFPLFSGTVLIALDGEPVAVINKGLANRETNQLHSAATLHSIASIGKVFTTLAIAQLVEQGEFDWSTPVVELIPELSERLPATVTVDHLASHRSGLGRIRNVSEEILATLQSNEDFFDLVLTTEISSAGPSDFSYNNANYSILGEIISRTSSQSYEAYIAAHIRGPAHMTGPVFQPGAQIDTRPIAQPYLPVDFERWWNSETDITGESADDYTHHPPPETPSAGGGGFASANDLMRFATALRTGTLLQTDAIEVLCTLPSDQAESGRGYARGCSVRIDENGMRVGHTGSSAGVHARFYLYVESGLDVIVLSNHEGQAGPVARAIDAWASTALTE